MFCEEDEMTQNLGEGIEGKVMDKVHFTDRQKALLLFLETKKRYGYEVKDLSYGTPRKVVHKCDVCGKPKETPFREFLLGQKWAHFKCKVSKMRQTNLKKFGVEYASQSPKIQEKIRQTFLEKYGVDNSQLSPRVRRKKEETNLKRYGVKYPLQSSEIRQKGSKTLLKRYGVDLPGKSVEIQDKIKRTNLRKYGVEYPLQSFEIRERWNQTNQERYGVEYPAQSGSVQEKMKKSMLEKYGVEYYVQLPEERERLIDWCRKHPEKMYTPKSELEILYWIQQYYPNAKKYKDEKGEIDIFISEINLGIEHNGLYWHQESVIGKKYHLNKTEYFKSKGIRVIHIFEHEWKNRQEQVKSFLLSAIRKNKHKIGARQCCLIWSSDKKDIQKVHQFLEDYHIQGHSQSTKYVIRVLYNNALIAVATFGKHHRNSKDWVLSRFCTKTNYTVQGLLSRISKMASKKLKENIISWADYRLSNGNGYEKAGWKFEELLSPDYFYHKGGKVVSKQSRQKRIVGTPKGMTEREHAKLEGWERVYDCGKIRYVYKGAYRGNA
jgi:hypothetical protein